MTAKNDTISYNKSQSVTPVYTAKEAAEYLKVHVETLKDYIAKGKLEASDINDAKSPNGRTYRITHEAIIKFLAERVVRRAK